AGTLNWVPASKVSQASLPGRRTVRAPATTFMISLRLVPNSYSPGAITPRVAGHSACSKAMDLTLPSKYSLTLNMGAPVRAEKARQYAQAVSRRLALIAAGPAAAGARRCGRPPAPGAGDPGSAGRPGPAPCSAPPGAAVAGGWRRIA